jgi:hypothetical protein
VTRSAIRGLCLHGVKRSLVIRGAYERRVPTILVGAVGGEGRCRSSRLARSGEPIDFVCREEFNFMRRDIAQGLPFESILGLSYRLPDGGTMHNDARPILENMADDTHPSLSTQIHESRHRRHASFGANGSALKE